MTFRQLRESRGFNQVELSKLSGVLKATISQIECGRTRDPQYSTVKRLADALGVTADTIARAIRETEAA